MPDRQLIVRLDGEDLDEDPASLLAYRLGEKIEFVATERDGADAAVVISRAQAVELARALTVALSGGRSDDPESA